MYKSKRDLAGISAWEVWLKYVSLGGSADLIEIEAHLAGILELPARERPMLRHAQWELAEGL